ncbi:MAG: hypothetical protein AAF721_09450 [Myxococcota bacterium]
MRLRVLLAAVWLIPACGGFDDTAAFGDSFQDDDIPMGDCQGTACPQTTAGDGGAGVGQSCDDTNQCATGVCAAPFADGQPGALVCQSACIDTMDESMWCSDTASCCDPAATCGTRGYCELPEGLDDSGSGSDDEGTSTGGTSDESGTTAGSDTDGTSGTTDATGGGSDESGATTAGTGAG